MCLIFALWNAVVGSLGGYAVSSNNVRPYPEVRPHPELRALYLHRHFGPRVSVMSSGLCVCESNLSGRAVVYGTCLKEPT
jgi:hypothetical protein